MVRVILKRIGLAFLTLFGVTVIVFALLQMMPGEPIDSIVPLDASEELRQVIIDQYGFDQPLYMQYFMWLGNAVRGNFGNSVSDNRLVLSVVSEALHNTLILALGASIFAFLLSILIGVYSSYRPNSIFSWIGTVFGIGGISMSGLAEILLKEHFKISGSDSKESELTDNLTSMGARIFYGQRAENILPGTDLVVYTAAIKEDNPEFAAAKEAGIPMLSRAELLGQIMDNYRQSVAVAGTHGKTTTTSMISQILLCAAADPTLSVGGILDAIGGNIRVGHSDIFVTEACEYTNSFLHFHPRYSIILDIEAEHLDFFKDINDIRHSFHLFAKNTISDGAIIMNGQIERPEEITEGLSQEVITYGLDPSFTYYAKDITYNEKACGRFSVYKNGEKLGEVALSVPGEHNVYNSLAAIAVTEKMGISLEDIIHGLSIFGGLN